ncbi:MAG: ATP-grasp domain-containing protein [bacterium]|nr:ATP-grasp domain-containing protein [bacterium]
MGRNVTNTNESKETAPVNVLITAASRRVALVRNFRLALEPCGGNVITVDYDIHSPALFFSHRHYKVPLVLDPDYLPTIETIVARENITLIIPTIDQELMLWARHKQQFKEKGIHVSISAPETIDICNDKWNTSHFFKIHDIPFPNTYLQEMLTYKMDYPLFIKPRNGRGSVQSYVVKNKKELDFFVEYVPEPLVQDYLQGKEFTVDAYFSLEGKLISYVPRYRLVIRSGVSDRGRTFKNEKLGRWVEKIGRTMGFEGVINLQGKIHKQTVTFFEINPRYSGSIQLSTAAGPNFSELMIRELNGETLEPMLGDYTANLTMTSYEDSLFLDSRRNISFFYNHPTDIIPTKNKTKL